jgi:hypothetical protein
MRWTSAYCPPSSTRLSYSRYRVKMRANHSTGTIIAPLSWHTLYSCDCPWPRLRTRVCMHDRVIWYEAVDKRVLVPVVSAPLVLEVTVLFSPYVSRHCCLGCICHVMIASCAHRGSGGDVAGHQVRPGGAGLRGLVRPRQDSPQCEGLYPIDGFLCSSLFLSPVLCLSQSFSSRPPIFPAYC